MNISMSQNSNLAVRRWLLAAGAVAALAGCATPQERAAQMQAEVDRMMQVYGPACTLLGFPAGSDPWRNCVLQLSLKDDVSREGPSYYGAIGRRHWAMGGRWGPYW